MPTDSSKWQARTHTGSRNMCYQLAGMRVGSRILRAKQGGPVTRPTVAPTAPNRMPFCDHHHRSIAEKHRHATDQASGASAMRTEIGDGDSDRRRHYISSVEKWRAGRRAITGSWERVLCNVSRTRVNSYSSTNSSSLQHRSASVWMGYE